MAYDVSIGFGGVKRRDLICRYIYAIYKRHDHRYGNRPTLRSDKGSHTYSQNVVIIFLTVRVQNYLGLRYVRSRYVTLKHSGKFHPIDLYTSAPFTALPV